MFTTSPKLFYVMEAVLLIASSPGGEPVNSKKLSANQSLPTRSLEQMLQQLVRVGVLRSIRGPRGGYVLARDKRHISLRDIYEAIEEDIPLEPSSQEGVGESLKAVWEKLHGDMLHRLESITVERCCRQRTSYKTLITDDTINFAI